MNILDVWFDSGSSHEAVLSVRPELTLAGRHLPRRQRPASRLVPELAARRPRHARPAAVHAGAHPRLPRRRRRPEDVEVARQLDRAAGHHQAERRRHPPAVGGDERLHARRSASARRSWRASSRRTASSATRCAILVANLYDFDPATDLVPLRAAGGGRSLHPRALRRRRPARCCAAYEDYDYGTIFQALNAFATVDLSAFYADVSKDRLYTFARAVARAALGADGDVPDGRRPDAAAGADPVVHRRRAVALPARRARGVGAPGAVSRRAASSTRCVDRGAGRALGRADRAARAGAGARSSRCARTSRSAARCRRKVVLSATGAELRAARAATPTQLPMLFIVSEVELRPAADVEAPARRAARRRSSAPAA